ncbi:MAG: OmpH family outer membrane protein [Colwellia sp.]|nr:OmpH family outer membrane protein [Colwellia sp.]
MHSVLKYIVTASLMSGLLACSEQSQDKVLVVDLSIVAKAVGRDTLMSTKLDEVNTALQQHLLTFKESIEKKVQTEKEKISGSTTKQQQEFQALVIKAKQTMLVAQNNAQEKSKQYQEQLLQQFKDDIQPIVSSIAKQQKASIVRVYNASLLWVDNAIDISDKVIIELKKLSAQTATNSDVTSAEKVDTTDTAKEAELVEQNK